MTDTKPELRIVEAGQTDAGLATLELISQARQALAEARTLPDIRRVMEAASVAADAAQRAAKLYNAERRAAEVVEAATAAANEAAAVRIEAQAKAGELLAQLRASGARSSGHNFQESQRATPAPTLGELGVSRSESHRWQQVADVPEEVRREYVEETKTAKGEVSTAGLLRHTKNASRPGPAATGDRSEVSSENREEVGPDRGQLVEHLHRALNALPTYPPMLVADLEGDDRKGFHRTARRVAQWFGYLMAELRREAADQPGSDFERVESIYTTVHYLRTLCGGGTGVRPDALVNAAGEDERSELLATIREVGAWLVDLEGELIRHGAGDDLAERDVATEEGS